MIENLRFIDFSLTSLRRSVVMTHRGLIYDLVLTRNGSETLVLWPRTELKRSRRGGGGGGEVGVEGER